MMTVTENSLPQSSIDYSNYAINRAYPLTYENPWQKSSPYPVYSHQSSMSFDANFYPQHQNYSFHWNNISYPSFYNPLPPINYSLPPPPPLPPLPPSRQTAAQSIPVKKVRRPRLTARIRSEIVKIKNSKPTIHIWEIQQYLIKIGVCTSQTVPNTSTIQRVLNQSIKIENPPRPSTSPTLSTSESQSECSICLECYRSGQQVSILACSHEYHSSCIAQWMIKNRSCPMCRKDIHNQPQFVTLLI